MLRKLFSALQSKKVSFIAGLTVAAAVVAGVSFGATVSAAAGPNDIMWGGFSSKSDFITKVKANNDNHNHKDLKNVYAYDPSGGTYGLDAEDYDRFVKEARPGKAYKDGRVMVDGQKVATNMVSIGRLAASQGSGYFQKSISGVTYYGNTNDKTFLSDPLDVMVLFNDKGEVEFVVINACGNPGWVTRVTPVYACNSLKATKVGEKKFTFTTDATAKNNAVITRVVYDFGDGHTQEVKTPGPGKDYPFTYTYEKYGDYPAKVKVYVKVPGSDKEKEVVAKECEKVIHVPFVECLELNAVFLDKDKMKVSFTAKSNAVGGAKFVSADFNFDEGDAKQLGVKPNADGVTASAIYTYTKAGTYHPNAVLHFTTADGKDVTADTCKTTITPEEIIKECKPGVPVGSPECLPPCTPGSSVPPESKECKPPELPKTGAGNTIAIFSVVVIGGFLAYRQLLFRKHRAAFSAAEHGTSALPLADPLSDTPLDGTPLEHKKRLSFRRKRQF